MAVPQKKMREALFQVLCAMDISSAEDELLPFMMEQLRMAKSAILQCIERANIIKEKDGELDAVIASISNSYEIDRIQRVERNALRLGLYELLYDESIPPKVAIAEAMRVTRKFASPEGASFVNAVLDAVYKKENGEEEEFQIELPPEEVVEIPEELLDTAMVSKS